MRVWKSGFCIENIVHLARCTIMGPLPGKPFRKPALRLVRRLLCVAGVLAAATPPASHAAPLVLHYDDLSVQQLSATISNNTTSFSVPFATTLDIPTILFVPGFDSSLGTLLSAHLSIDAGMASFVVDHAGAPTGYVRIAHEFTTGMELTASNSLKTILQNSSEPTFSLELSQYFSPSSKSDTAFIGPYVETIRERSSELHFDELFTGASLGPFIDSGLSFVHFSGSQYLFMSGSHEGGLLTGAISQFLEFPTEIQPGTKPGIGTAVLLAARLANYYAEQSTGHGLVYSDMHVSTAAVLTMDVDYTYEPVSAVSVPEPGTLALLALGVAGLAASRRRKQ